MAAVGKRPGSISADSAVGTLRSSVITGTTAGVTQFSEVSQITAARVCSNVPYSILRIWSIENYVISKWEWDMV